MTRQYQFLHVVDRDTADRRFRAAIETEPLGEEHVSLDASLGRVLSRDVVASVNVPSFDRSNFDGYAVRAEDTYGAREESPRRLTLLDEVIATGVAPSCQVGEQQAAAIATGGMIPRGADSIVMIEHTEPDGAGGLLVNRAVTPGRGIAFAGGDIAAGETVLRRGELLTSRETGLLAAIGEPQIAVWRCPVVGVISTGDEIIPPGETMSPGLVYDSNARILCDAIREAGGEPKSLGIVRDDLSALRETLHKAIEECDLVLLSGGTSKGEGDLCYHVVAELANPGIVAHGVALKPGKPICLAAENGKGVVVLPGFPTSAIFTFHEFVSPVIRELAGTTVRDHGVMPATMAVSVNSEIGRTEFMLVGLARSARADDKQGNLDAEPSAYPMGQGSGSITTFSKADGIVVIPREQEILEAGSRVEVRLLGRDLALADLSVIGSHCVGLDLLLGMIERQGYRCKNMNVGSTAGLLAAQRAECDVAGIHLFDSESGQYNKPLLGPDVVLLPGYGRMQTIVFREDDERFSGLDLAEIKNMVQCDCSLLMVNRNQGSGTRVLLDQWLDGARPNGYANQSKSHNAVAAAVAQGRADWGVAIQISAIRAGLSSIPLAEERFDFAVPAGRLERVPVQAFRRLLEDKQVRQEFESLGFTADRESKSRLSSDS